MLDGVEADRSELQGLLHRRMQIGEFEAFQEPQYLHIAGVCVSASAESCRFSFDGANGGYLLFAGGARV